jgi:hypothetical protein
MVKCVPSGESIERRLSRSFEGFGQHPANKHLGHMQPEFNGAPHVVDWAGDGAGRLGRRVNGSGIRRSTDKQAAGLDSQQGRWPDRAQRDPSGSDRIIFRVDHDGRPHSDDCDIHLVAGNKPPVMGAGTRRPRGKLEFNEQFARL